MNDAAETRYVAVGDADVAYQIVGDGSFDVVYVQGLGRHLEAFHETPGSPSSSNGWPRSLA
jgi:hypothetical protein